MKKAAFLIMIITITSKILGFGRELVQSYVYGASAITDVYLISQTIPTQIFAFINAGIATSFIPIYSRILKQQGKLNADRYTNNLINLLLLLATATVVIVLLFTGPVVKIFAKGFTGETLDLAVSFTRISVFAVYFSALLSISGGYLRLHRNYTLPSLAGLFFNLIIIPSLILSAKTSIYVLIIGSVIASGVQLLAQMPAIYKLGYRYKHILNLKDKHVRMMIIFALPLMLSRSVDRINVLVDRTLASAIAVGGISALNYATRIGGFVQGLFVDSITTVIYPNISKMVAEDNIKGLKRVISEAIGIINLIVIPATVGAMLFSREIVSLLFGRGAFTPEAIQMTGIALFYYSIGMIPKGLRSVASRSFYAHQDTKTPVINATVGVVINIILNIILSRYMGLGGLALATSISAIVTALLMFITLRKKIGPFGLSEIVRSFIKITIASAAMGLVAFSCFKFPGKYFTQDLALTIAVIIGMLTYGVIIYFMKIPEADNTLKIIKNKVRGIINSEKTKA